jgi:hypothetical protein
MVADKEDVKEEITREQYVEVARQLGDNWKKLAGELLFTNEDIADFEDLPDEETKLPAAKMIFLWQASADSAPVKFIIVISVKGIDFERISFLHKRVVL